MASFENDGGRNRVPTLKFPANLESIGNVYAMRMSVTEFFKENPQDTGLKRRPGGTLYLPIPSNLSNTHSVTYNDEDRGFLNEVAGDALASGAAYGEAARTAGNKLIENGVGAAVTRTIVNLAPDSISGAAFGGIVNPRSKVNFGGISFKNHQFSWKLVARTAEESREISHIIQFLNYHSSPQVFQDALMLKPDVFRLNFLPNERFLFSIGECFLTDVSTSYNQTSGGAYFQGTLAPVEVDLNLTFKEITLQTKNRLKFQYRTYGSEFTPEDNVQEETDTDNSQ